VLGLFRTIKEVVPIMRRQQKQQQQQQQQQSQSTTTAEGVGGTIINIGSANGFFGVPCASAYVATKFALEGVIQSLRYELAPFGIKVSIIEPGATKTDVATRNMLLPKKKSEQQQHQLLPSSFLNEEEKEKSKDINMSMILSSLSPFIEMTKTIMEKSKAAVASGSDPKLVAEMVLKIYKTKRPEWRYLVGDDSQKLFEARRQLSDSEFEKFLYKLFNSE
jgi:NAD(P)-dependent dehydrogenase (short-subunit alcohol dehydrogenase family)